MNDKNILGVRPKEDTVYANLTLPWEVAKTFLLDINYSTSLKLRIDRLRKQLN